VGRGEPRCGARRAAMWGAASRDVGRGETRCGVRQADSRPEPGLGPGRAEGGEAGAPPPPRLRGYAMQ